MVTVHTLGRTLIEAADARVTPTSTRKFALMLYLSVEAGRRVSRTVLRDLVFPEQTERNARHSLRELVYQIRQAGILVESDPDGIAFCRTLVHIDYIGLLSRGRFEISDFRAIEGGFLPGYAPAHSEAFSEWLEGYRARTTFELCKGLLADVSRARAIGDWTITECAARACLALDPVNEEATLSLAEMLARGGAKAQAVKLLDQYVADIGPTSREMRIPPTVVRRRISDQKDRATGANHRSTFVGRSKEMLEIQRQFQLAKKGQAECVILFGEPGIGKSRLLAEFETVAELEGAVCTTTSMQSNDAHRPFGAFADLLPELLSKPGALGCAPESLRCLDRLSKVPQPAAPSLQPGADGEALSDAVTRAIVDLIDAIASEQPIVLAIEDVHWMDDTSAKVLTALASRRRRRKLLMLLTTRQLKSTDFLRGSAEALTTVHLRRLTDEAVSEMTASLAESGSIAIDQVMGDWLVATAEGNPLFVESLFGHYATTNERFAISPTLIALLGRRVDMLSREAATLLRVCGLLGKHSTIEMICTATDLPQFVMVRAVAELEEAGLIKVDGTNIHPSHALVADVAEQKAGIIERRFEHRCVALALESLLKTEYAAAVLWDCAEHWMQAEDSERAVNAIGSCARYALEIGRPRDAAGMFKRALTLDLRRPERLKTARQMLLAADAAGEPDLVFDGLRVLQLHGAIQEHDEIEFADFRARARALHDAPIETARLLRCATETSATAAHRVEAALWILRYADIHGQFDFAPAAIAAIPDDLLAASSGKIRLEFILVRACVLGDWDTVGQAAGDLLTLSLSEPFPIASATQFNAAAGLWRAGLFSRALEAATFSHTSARASGSLRPELLAIALLTDFNLERCNDESVRVWIDRGLALLSALPDLANHFPFALMRTSALITFREYGEARCVFDDASARGVFDGSRIRERWKAALELRLKQAEGRDVMLDDEIQRLTQEFDRSRPMAAVLDFEVATACDALLMRRRPLDARVLCDRFLESKSRSRSPRARSVGQASEAIDRALHHLGPPPLAAQDSR